MIHETDLCAVSLEISLRPASFAVCYLTQLWNKLFPPPLQLELFWIVKLGGPEDLVLLVFHQVKKQQVPCRPWMARYDVTSSWKGILVNTSYTDFFSSI